MLLLGRLRPTRPIAITSRRRYREDHHRAGALTNGIQPGLVEYTFVLGIGVMGAVTCGDLSLPVDGSPVFEVYGSHGSDG